MIQIPESLSSQSRHFKTTKTSLKSPQNPKTASRSDSQIHRISGAFERRRYMNLVVHKANHSELHDYIHSAVSGLFSFVEKGLVDRVAVVFFDGHDIPLERYIFKLQVNQAYGSKVEEAGLVFSLRSFLLKLSVTKAVTRVLPKGSSSGQCKQRCRVMDSNRDEAMAALSTNNSCFVKMNACSRIKPLHRAQQNIVSISLILLSAPLCRAKDACAFTLSRPYIASTL